MPRSARTLALATDAIIVEGGLIAPVMLARIAAQQADGQSDADYRIPKGLTLRDEIARYFRIGQAIFAEFSATERPSSSKTIEFAEALFRDVFGFSDIARVGTRRVDHRLFAVSLEGLSGRVPMVVVPPADSLDRASDHLPTDGRRRSAASAVQDWLNAHDGALWGFCCNGEHLRLLRDNASLTRPAYIEADLRQIFEADAFADFTLLWLLVHVSRFGVSGSPASDCMLERWREAGSREGAVARDRLRDGVEVALKALGTGFLTENLELRRRVQANGQPLSDFFGQLLRLVYRLIFLLVAEDRGLLHAPDASPAVRSLYTQGYSLSSLRDRAARRTAWDTHHDKWEGLAVVFRALACGEKRLGLPALGGLFTPDMMPDLEAARLPNKALMEAIFSLAWLREDAGLVPVNWRDLETEELGSVYESLLELTPRLIEDGRGFAFAEGDEAKGHARKTTGSYYTPDSLVQVLLDSALDPVLNRVEAEADDPASALLSVTVLDPACGSGHFLLAAARRIATRLARTRAGGVASAQDFRHALRDVARACLYGVDRNPMAVELTKVALWIETVEPGKPLGFLDANIRCGDALLGVFDMKVLEAGVPDGAYKPLTSDDKETARYFEKQNRSEREGQGTLDFTQGGGRLPPMTPLAGEIRALRALPEDSPAEIEAKRVRFEAARADPRRWNPRIAADLYIAAFLTPKTGGVPANRNTVTIPTTAHVWHALDGRTVYGLLVRQAQDLAAAARAFHWPLEFPDIMTTDGFDVVLGNPPWEVMQLSEEEYFAQRLPELIGIGGAARKQAIAALEHTRPNLFAEYRAEKRRFEAGSEFARASNRFTLTARGKINTYALFAELFLRSVTKRGRAGLIVPTGIATADTYKEFFSDLVQQQTLVSLFSFYETRYWFTATDDKNSFCLLTIGAGPTTPVFVFDAKPISDLTDPRRRFSLSRDDIARINPDSNTAPIFRATADAGLASKLYAAASSCERPLHWIGLKQNVFTSSNALDLTEFSRSKDPGEAVVPVFRGTMMHQYDEQYSTFIRSDFEHVPSSSKTPNYEVTSDKYIALEYYLARMESKDIRPNFHLAIRRIARSSDERTMIAAMLPRVGTDDTASVLTVNARIEHECCLLANLNSLTLDCACTYKIAGADIRKHNFSQLPLLGPAAYLPEDLAFIVPRVLELTHASHSMAPFARALGYDGLPFTWDEDRRAQLRAELDAWYARAYGLTRNELRYVLDPEDVMGAGYPSETFRVLKQNEIRRFGEYRTARLVLGAWDRIERGEIDAPTPSVAIAVTPAPAAPRQVPAEVVSLPEGAWARSSQPQPGDVGAVLAAILKAMDSPQTIRDVRLAAALVLEPRLLVPLLPKEEAETWHRLVGSEADPLPNNVASFAARINAAWGNAVRNHRGNDRLIENLQDGTWTAGAGLDAIDTSGWPDDRARFVLGALKSVDFDIATNSLPSEIQQWVADAAAA